MLGLWGMTLGHAEESISVQDEYQAMAKAIKRRYQGYLKHQEILEEQEAERLKGVEKHKLLREKVSQREELERKKFIETRKPPEDDTEARRRYEATLAAREAEEEKARALYVNKRNQLRDLLEKEVGIPPEKEVGL